MPRGDKIELSYTNPWALLYKSLGQALTTMVSNLWGRPLGYTNTPYDTFHVVSVICFLGRRNGDIGKSQWFCSSLHRSSSCHSVRAQAFLRSSAARGASCQRVCARLRVCECACARVSCTPHVTKLYAISSLPRPQATYTCIWWLGLTPRTLENDHVHGVRRQPAPPNSLRDPAWHVHKRPTHACGGSA